MGAVYRDSRDSAQQVVVTAVSGNISYPDQVLDQFFDTTKQQSRTVYTNMHPVQPAVEGRG